MELFLLDPRKWVEFLLHPTIFFSKKMKFDLRLLFVEFLVLSFIIALVSEYTGFLAGKSTYIYANTLLERTLYGFSVNSLFAIFAFWVSKILKGKGTLAQNTYAVFLPGIFGLVSVILPDSIPYGMDVVLLLSLVYAIIALKTVNKYSIWKGLGVYIVCLFSSGIVLDIVGYVLSLAL